MLHCRWYLAEYDVDTFEMTDELLREMKEAKCHDVVPVEFNGGHRKEIEVELLMLMTIII